ncbi:MAG: hypothetical protein ACTSX6_12930 [Candidatus Heimdallarchaeaceae archaeon]
MSFVKGIWDKDAALPSVITVFALSLLAQIPHFYYLHNIVEFNTARYLPLLIAFPLFGTIGLSALSLLITENLLRKVRNEKERKLFRYLLRGSLIAITIYFVIQILIVFFAFEAIGTFRDLMPKDIIDNVTFKEVFGISLILIIGVFINPPTIQTTKGKKK